MDKLEKAVRKMNAKRKALGMSDADIMLKDKPQEQPTIDEWHNAYMQLVKHI